MKKLSIKLTTLLLVCLTFLLTGAISLNSTYVKADESHQVVFMLDENTEYQTQTVENYLSVPETPAMAGKIFLHWADEQGNKFSFKTKIESDRVLTAVWQLERAMFTVKFCVNGQVVNEQIVAQGQTAVAPVEFDCGEGKVFDCWDNSFDNVMQDTVVNAVLKDKEYTVILYGFEKQILSVQTVRHGDDFDFPTIPEIGGYDYSGYTGNAENIVQDGKIYLNYTPIPFNVSFYVDGNPFAQLESIEVGRGNTVPFPGVVSRAGYVFMGWYIQLDDVEPYDFSLPLYGHLELHAKLVPIIEKYTVKFFDFDGNQYGGTQTVEQGKSAILPGSPYKDGYEFVGWDKDFQNITADTEIYPIFKIKSYTVKFYNGQTLIGEPQVVNHGNSAVEPEEIPYLEGYDFIRWDKNFNKVNGDLDVYAVFEEKTFVVMFYSHNMKKIGATQYVKYGQSAVAPNLAERVGFDFLGWDGDYTNIVEDAVFVAQYQAKVYTLDFYYGDQKVYTQSVEYGNAIDFYVYELEDYLFYGWYLDQEFTMPFSFNTVLDGDLSVYAKMQAKPNQTFTVIFKVESTVVSSQTVEEFQPAILPATPQKEGYTFVCWDIESGSGNIESITGDIVYIAVFEVNFYKVSFVYGTHVYEEQIIEYRNSATSPGVELVGHTFVGWDKAFDCITSDLTVNAIFEANDYQVVFQDLESSEVYSTITVKYGQKVSIPKSPQKEGYIFKRWKTFNGGQMVDFSFDTAISGDTIIYAEFEGKPYSIYYYINGELYYTQRVLYNDVIIAIDPPYYDDNYVFSGWGEMPSVMPAKNLTFSATALRYYTVNYLINNDTYHTERVLEGQKIPVPNSPDYNDIQYSFKWENIPSVMPDMDITINGRLELVSANIDNEFVLVVYVVEGKTYIDLIVRGNVNVGGMLIDIRIRNLNLVGATIEEDYSDYNVEGDKIKLVWAKGQNLTEFKQIAGFIIDGEITDTNLIQTTVSAYAFNQDVVESVNSSITIIKK